jgi:hypothetical protein
VRSITARSSAPREERGGELIPRSTSIAPLSPEREARLLAIEAELKQLREQHPEQSDHDYYEEKFTWLGGDRPLAYAKKHDPSPVRKRVLDLEDGRLNLWDDELSERCTPAMLNALPPYLRAAVSRLRLDLERETAVCDGNWKQAFLNIRGIKRAVTLLRYFDLPPSVLVEVARGFAGGQRTLCDVYDWISKEGTKFVAEYPTRPFFLADNVPMIAAYLHRELAARGVKLTAEGPKKFFVNDRPVPEDWMTGTAFRDIIAGVDIMDPRHRTRAPLTSALRREIREAVAEMHPRLASTPGSSGPAPLSLPAPASSTLDDFGRERLVPADWTDTRELRTAYVGFCQQHGATPVSGTAFGLWLKSRPGVRRIQNGRVWGYAGVGLREP